MGLMGPMGLMCNQDDVTVVLFRYPNQRRLEFGETGCRLGGF